MFIPFTKVKYAISEVCKLSEMEECMFALSPAMYLIILSQWRGIPIKSH